jgi:hypothetical protein
MYKSPNNNTDEKFIKFNLLTKLLTGFFLLLLLSLYFFYSRLLLTNLIREVHWPLRQSVNVDWPPPLILSWNGFFGRPTAMQWLLNENDISKCPYLCQYSGNQSL